MGDPPSPGTGRSRPTVLITGGSSGIGTACVRAFVQAGYRVWFTYRSGEQAAASLVDEVGEQNAVTYYLDQGDWDSVQQLVTELPAAPDALVHCAGLGSATVNDYATEPQERQRALLTVNALGPLWLTEALLPQMTRRGRQAKIVFLASVGGGITQFPAFNQADGMSKAAVAFLARNLAANLVHDPVDVFAVCPGATDTPMLQASTLSKLTPPQRSALINALPGSRLIIPQEIADLVLFLCSSSAGALHGCILDASLGLGVRPGLLTELPPPAGPAGLGPVVGVRNDTGRRSG
ncbi:SDR family oxidoreductase [Kribbella sp. NBC_00359]|uniref:SDR family oxidoreductase n=1 Tax=Kribbella sp. NBC_00359 TaxID=2975966 RepID=UPI002E1CC2D7